ncbi:MAG: CopG family transcriptional regulator [Chloroflexi bacterium]|nr:CopG family transcriptional regulator [Chloroflexota bacterium]MDL1944389.1 CopG family transcriptional regulator [Chloroflexi bacterium CFX2]
MNCTKTKAPDFDKKFDDGESVIEDLDLSKARRPAEEQKHIDMEIPAWMLDALEREARRLGVIRQSIIKIWLAERLEQAGR